MKQEALNEMVDHQVPYEVDMLRWTYVLLAALGVPQTKRERAIANAYIESFCTHARNLIEFFSHQSLKPKDYASARHFTVPSFRPL